MVVTLKIAVSWDVTLVVRMNVPALKVLGASSFKMLVAVIHTTRHYIPEDRTHIN
jgi:hypothetical protein